MPNPPRNRYRFSRPVDHRNPAIGTIEEGTILEGREGEDGLIHLIAPDGHVFTCRSSDVVQIEPPCETPCPASVCTCRYSGDPGGAPKRQLRPEQVYEGVCRISKAEHVRHQYQGTATFLNREVGGDLYRVVLPFGNRDEEYQLYADEIEFRASRTLVTVGEDGKPVRSAWVTDEGEPETEKRESKGTVYLSGPMTGIPEYNYPAFDRAETVLRAMGYDVINPAALDKEEGTDGMDWHDFLKRDLAAILTDDTVVGLVYIDGWRNSRGAALEGYVAQQAGIKTYELVNDVHAETLFLGEEREQVKMALRPVDMISVAYEAQGIVLGARRFSYGHPLDNFMKIAELFNAALSHKLTEPLDVRDVTTMMILTKVAREYNAPKEDNRLDIVGYALAYDEALKEMAVRGGDESSLLSGNAALLRQHSVLGADTNRKSS